MQRISLLGIVTLMIAGMAIGDVSAWAQERERQREGRGQREGGRRGPGGPGGFGGGFQGRGSGGGPGAGGVLGLLRIDKVQDELKIGEDQEELIQVLRDDLAEQRPEFARNLRDLSEAEREAAMKEMAEWRAKQDKEAKATLATILQPEQYQRLMQINIQVQGANALADEDVAAKLNLTDEQKAKIAAAIEANRDASRERMREAFQGGGRGQRGEGGFAEMRERMEAIRKENDAKVLALLTDEQKTAFEAMKGEAFEMPTPQFGGGFGGGRGGFGGGRGPGGGRGGDGDRPQRPRRPE